MKSPVQLLQEAGFVRRNLIAFAVLTAIINGLVTASVGAWLAQTYSSHQSRRIAVQSLADLVYERRTRAGLVVSTLRRGGELEELRQRKRDYDDIFVEWNKRIQTNMLRIREVIGTPDAAGFEELLQGSLVRAMSEMDSCLTRGYDVRIAGGAPMPVVEACKFPALYQFVLDCAKGLTDELHELTRLTFMPFGGNSRRTITEAVGRARAACARPPSTLPSPVQPTTADTPAKGN